MELFTHIGPVIQSFKNQPVQSLTKRVYIKSVSEIVREQECVHVNRKVCIRGVFVFQ